MRVCSLDGCERKHMAKDLCNIHYQKRYRTGNPLTIHLLEDPIKRFNKKIKINEKTGCHEWIGSKLPKGYGTFRLNTETAIRAHRFSYEYYKHKIPENMHCLHNCDNPSCVNPDHLFLGTNNDNVKDKMRKGRSYRPIGEKHPFAKIKDADVYKIKELIASGYSYRETSILMNTTIHIVAQIGMNKTWTHLNNRSNNG